MAYQDEKADEKRDEKRDEKQHEEKSWEEKGWRRDTLSGTIWALILIWAGVVFLLVTTDVAFLSWLNWGNAWGAVMLGAGILLVLEMAIRLMVPAYAAPLRGRTILALILIFSGLNAFIDFELWPFLLIAIGLWILISNLTGSKR